MNSMHYQRLYDSYKCCTLLFSLFLTPTEKIINKSSLKDYRAFTKKLSNC
jgi:hypothetical protein